MNFVEQIESNWKTSVFLRIFYLGGSPLTMGIGKRISETKYQILLVAIINQKIELFWFFLAFAGEKQFKFSSRYLLDHNQQKCPISYPNGGPFKAFVRVSYYCGL